MALGFELVVGGVVLLHVLLLGAVVYYDAVASAVFHRRFGTTPGAVVAAGSVGSAAAIGLAVAGRLPPWLDVGSRSAAFTLALLAVPLVVGFVGAAVTYGNGQTLRRLDESGPTTTPTDGDRVAVTGVVTPQVAAGTTPLFGRPAVCWTWRLDARNWGGSTDGQYHTVRSGHGSVPFVLDTEAGRLRIDPSDATLERSGERVEETPAETFPAGADPSAVDHDWSLPGDRWRHRERVLDPDATVSVLGTVEETPDGPTVAGGDPFVVTTGGLERYRRRCRTRLQAGALVAVGGLVGGTWLLVETFAVPL
ncbi:GIDE domain-containing protein [Halomarina oriensis]|uniref:RING-type E3 ubiquitin transferase n=1 Tax=Halomarina oriensis TaxID=671145 RepID=A0A6B0GGU5_9EURY|nr:GIDE domain-containing protein [Halomarina oriensis]MWG34092.1 hypothetical protein [Halomarina oriensis]